MITADLIRRGANLSSNHLQELNQVWRIIGIITPDFLHRMRIDRNLGAPQGNPT